MCRESKNNENVYSGVDILTQRILDFVNIYVKRKNMSRTKPLVGAQRQSFGGDKETRKLH